MARIVNAPGIGNPFAVHDQQIDGGDVFLHTLYVEQNGVLLPLLDADGFRLPSKVLFADASGLEVAVANAATGTVRVEVEGGARVVPGGIDGAPIAYLQDGGVAALFATDSGNYGFARISDERVLYTLGPPRGHITQTDTPRVLTTTAETLLLPLLAPPYYLDITHLDITTDYVTQQDPSIKVHLRDSTGGTIRWTIAVGEKAGAVLPIYRKQTSPGNDWTIQLSAAPPAGRSIFVNATAEARLIVGG